MENLCEEAAKTAVNLTAIFAVLTADHDKYTVTDYTCQNCGQHKTEKTRNPNYQFRCKRCDWYDARKDTKGVLGLIYKLIHDITHMVQHINFLT